MSRSRKKNPYAPMCGGSSQAEWKRIYNRRLRRCNTQLLQAQDDDTEYYTVDQKGNPYDSPYDGTKGHRGERPVSDPVGRCFLNRWFGRSLKETQEDWDRMMRK